MAIKLETRLTHYFLLIVVAAMMISIEFYVEMSRPELKDEICNIADQHPVTKDDGMSANNSAMTSILDLRNKVLIMFGLLLVVIAIVMTMFMRNITMPLVKMADATKLINAGDLSQIVLIEHDDEIGLVGNAINDLTSNLQETATFTSSTIREAKKKFDLMAKQIAQQKLPDDRRIKEIRDNLKVVIDFVDSFTLLDPDFTRTDISLTDSKE